MMEKSLAANDISQLKWQEQYIRNNGEQLPKKIEIWQMLRDDLNRI